MGFFCAISELDNTEFNVTDKDYNVYFVVAGFSDNKLRISSLNKF